MRKLFSTIAALLLAFPLTQISAGAAQAAVFDAVQNGAGGNWYRLVTNPLSFDDAAAAAENTALGGAIGHLVTISSGNENTFVAQVAKGKNVWLGAARYDVSPGFEYRWAFGPDADLAFTGCIDFFASCQTLNSLYTAWDRNNAQPDGNLNFEDTVAMNSEGTWFDTISWNDDKAIVGYVIEYETDEMTETPDPTSGSTGDTGGGDNGGGGTDTTAPATFIVGDASVGQIIAADISDWPAGASISYQWILDGEDIVGATSYRYAIVPTDAEHTLTVRASGTIDGVEVSSESEPVDVLKGIIDPAPAPTITGTAKVGKTITATTGTWMDGVELSYQWYANDDPIDGAIDSTLDLEGPLAGTFVTVEVTAFLEGYDESIQLSDGVEILVGTLTKTPTPTITGTLKTGQKLTAKENTWDADVEFEYTWFANKVAIKGANAKTFTLTPAQFGKTISVAVTGSKLGYKSVTKASAVTAKVAVGTMTAPVPKIAGGIKGAKFVTVTSGTWPAGVKLTYQWLLDGKAIKNSKASKLVLNKKMKGHKISVSVTGTATGYVATTKTSVALKITW